MMWDALLRLHDRDVERRFWVSPAVKGTLLSVDRGAVLTVLVNNASLVHYVTRMVSDGALDPWVLHFCYMQAMFYVASQLAVSWWATAKPDQYYRRRDLVVFGLRVARFFGGIVMMVPPGRSIGGDAFLPPYVLGPGSAWFKVARLLVQRSAVAWALFITAQVRPVAAARVAALRRPFACCPCRACLRAWRVAVKPQVKVCSIVLVQPNARPPAPHPARRCTVVTSSAAL